MFRVRLPVAHAIKAVVEPQPAVQTRPSSRRRLDGVRVLVVDDDGDALSMVRELLEAAGANVTTALSADEALAVIERQPPDLLLSDIGMPAMDGFELIRRIRAAAAPRFAHLPAAALTAYAQPRGPLPRAPQRFPGPPRQAIDPGELLTAVERLAGRN